MAHVNLVIEDLGTVDGYRIVSNSNETKFTNPVVLDGDTVSWHSPKKDAYIAILDDSPFTRNQTAVTREILKIEAGGTSAVLQIAKIADEKSKYEYAVLVREAVGDYTYVRGAASPPGVIVGP